MKMTVLQSYSNGDTKRYECETDESDYEVKCRFWVGKDGLPIREWTEYENRFWNPYLKKYIKTNKGYKPMNCIELRQYYAKKNGKPLCSFLQTYEY